MILTVLTQHLERPSLQCYLSLLMQVALHSVSSSMEVLSPQPVRELLRAQPTWPSLEGAGCLVSERVNEQMSQTSPLCPELMETRWQRTVTYDSLRGKNGRQGLYLAVQCEHQSHHCDCLLKVGSQGTMRDQASLEGKSVFPKGAKSFAALRCLQGSVRNLSKALTFQCFEEVNGSLFSFLAFAKID